MLGVQTDAPLDEPTLKMNIHDGPPAPPSGLRSNIFQCGSQGWTTSPLIYAHHLYHWLFRKRQGLYFTESKRLQLEHQTIYAPLLYSPIAPCNLLGRDLLCKFSAKILCSPLGLYVTFDEPSNHAHLLEEEEELEF